MRQAGYHFVRTVVAAVLAFGIVSGVRGDEVYDRYANLNLPEANLRAWLRGPGADYFQAVMDEDIRKAKTALDPLAADGDGFAQAFLGELLYHTALNPAAGRRAMSWIEKSAAGGNYVGQTLLGGILCDRQEDGDGARAEELLRGAAEAGSPYAMFELGRCHHFDLLGAAEPGEVAVWMTLAGTTFADLEAGSGEQLFWVSYEISLEERLFLEILEPEVFISAGLRAREVFDRILQRARDGGESGAPVEYWSGQYYCAQGATGATLVLDGTLTGQDQTLDGIVHFFPLPENPDVPEGCASGTVEVSTDADGAQTLFWKPERWLLEAEGYSLTAGSTGTLEFGGLVAYGEIDHPLCSEVLMQRVILPPRLLPEACTFGE